MLHRTSTLVHSASGLSLETPLLVPSFSSKAFGFPYDGRSEVRRFLDVAQGFITKTCLVSAYDVHYNYVPEPDSSVMNVDLIFLDSGGYEAGNDCDLSTIERPARRPEKWDSGKLQAIWTRWPTSLPSVFVSYDHSNLRIPVLDQLMNANQARREHPEQLHSFLLKPQSKEDINLESALQTLNRYLGELQEFDLIGVTEKELGSSFLDRMTRLATLRKLLDNASLQLPIHVFGTLDPLSVSLYLMAGAEVFDGLTWSRYAFQSGQCIYIHSNSAMAYGIDVNDDEARVRTIKDNIRHLGQLERSLREFAKTGDWDLLNDNRDFVRHAADQMRSQLDGRD